MAGRPSDYADATVEAILDALTDGQSLRQICAGRNMPNRRTVLRWLEQHPDFAAKYARAREAQADLMDDKILEVADNCTPETAQADRVKIGAYQWRAAKLLPKKYGDAQRIEHTGADGGPIETRELSKTEVARRVAWLLTTGLDE